MQLSSYGNQPLIFLPKNNLVLIHSDGFGEERSCVCSSVSVGSVVGMGTELDRGLCPAPVPLPMAGLTQPAVLYAQMKNSSTVLPRHPNETSGTCHFLGKRIFVSVEFFSKSQGGFGRTVKMLQGICFTEQFLIKCCTWRQSWVAWDSHVRFYFSVQDGERST